MQMCNSLRIFYDKAFDRIILCFVLMKYKNYYFQQKTLICLIFVLYILQNQNTIIHLISPSKIFDLSF